MLIFGSRVPGTATRVSVQGMSGGVSFSAGAIVDPSRSGIVVTSVGYSGRSSLQLMQSLGDSVYVYNFGLRDTALVVSGIIFLVTCGPGGTSDGSAITSMINDFQRHAKDAIPVSITVGSASFSGLVDTFRTTYSDHRNASSGFELRLHLITDSMGTSSP